MKASSCCWHGIGTGVPARPGQIFGMCSISPSDFFHHTGGRLCKGGHSGKDARLTCGGVQGSCQQAEAKEDAQQIHGARTGRGAGQGMDVRPLELQAHQMPRKPWRMELGQQLSEMCNAGAFRRVVKERQWNSRLLEAPYQLRFCCGSIRECCPAARGCSMQVS